MSVPGLRGGENQSVDMLSSMMSSVLILPWGMDLKLQPFPKNRCQVNHSLPRDNEVNGAEEPDQLEDLETLPKINGEI